MKLRWFLLLSAVLVLEAALSLSQASLSQVSAASDSESGKGPPPAWVLTDPVRRENITPTKPVDGHVLAPVSGSVAALVEGPVAEIPVRVGDRVATGDPLVNLIQDWLVFALEEAQASFAEAEADVRIARAERDRLSKLRGSSALNRAKLEDAKNRFVRAQASLNRYHAILERAQKNLDSAIIRAPYEGFVMSIIVEMGEYVRAGDRVVALMGTQSLEIEAAIPARFSSYVSPDETVTIVGWQGNRLDSRLRALLPRENVRTRMQIARFMPIIPITPPAMADKESVMVLLPTGPPRTALTVHKDAIMLDGRSKRVVIAQNGKAVIKPVQLGAEVDDRQEVLQGLEEGQLVVIRGNEALRPGAPLAIGKIKP